MDKLIETGKIRQMFPSQDVAEWLNLDYRDNFWSPEGKPLTFTTKTSLYTDKLGYNYDTMKKGWELSDIPLDEPVAEVSTPLEAVEAAIVSAPENAGLKLNSERLEALRIRFQISSRMFSSPYPLRSLRLKTYGVPSPKDATTVYRVTLEIGSQRLALADIAFFPGAAGKHADHGSIGINLNRHKELVRNLAQNSVQAALVLQPVDKKRQPKTLAETFDEIPNKSSMKISLKAVFVMS